ncbi:SgcJ/EcaC family oxidoreductase [Lysobacter antibioticus]|nr:SgcJ/EcaC family oxidoreductase [Lysobacter antibioticus]
MNTVLTTSLVVAAMVLLPASMPAGARAPKGAACAQVTEPQVAALFNRWNDSLRTGDPDKVLANYAEDGVLLATLSNEPRTSRAAMRDYFVKFLKSEPQGTIDKRVIKIGCNVAQDLGTYAFKFADGKTVHARYTYVYEWRNGKWLIAHHHSSAMPEPVGGAGGTKPRR